MTQPLSSTKAGGRVMTDTVNVPREWLRDVFLVLSDWNTPLGEKLFSDTGAMLAAAPKAEPVANPMVFGRGALVVDHGKYGGEPAVFVAKAKSPGQVGEFTGREYFDRESLQPGELVLQFPTDAQAKSVADALVGSLAPASDELLEALKPFAEAAVDLDDGETGHIWERPSAMSIDAADLRRAAELYDKHKGPQS